jgi:biotin operon repressor
MAQAGEVQRLLMVAADGGESLSLAELQEELAIGHADLMAALEELRELGTAVETAPGEWSGPEAIWTDPPEDPPEDPPVPPAESSPPEEPETAPAEPPDRPVSDPEIVPSAQEALSGPAFLGQPMFGWSPSPATAVRLTPGVAAALSAEALGGMVLAGMEEAKVTGGRFVLVVE